MTVHNREIAECFDRLATLLEIEGSNPFRVRAYRNAARVIEGQGAQMSALLAEGQDLSELPGIGEDLSAKIATLVETGSLPLLEEVEKRVPAALAKMTEIEGLGPKRVGQLYRELDIRSIEDLEQALEDGRVHELDGFGEKLEGSIAEGIANLQDGEQRMRWADAEAIAEPLADWLREIEGVKQVSLAGSYRRCKETVGDLDILVSCRKDSSVMDRFVEHEEVARVVSHGTTRSSVHLRSGLQVDLRVVPAVSFGAALHYFTGSKAHNIAVRRRGVERGYKINEYGVYRDDDRLAGRTEEEVFESVELPYIAPELREDRGEIDAAESHELPELVTLEDLRGDLHSHTDATDGADDLETMARAAAERGHEYLAVTDHSKAVRVANGLDADRLLEQVDAIEALNDQLDGITLLKGIEVDILADGRLDLSDDVLERLDVVVCSIHSRFNLSEKQQTERVLRAMENPHFNILAHPTGRLINRRRPYAIDLGRVIKAAAERGAILEVNAQPSRLDLDDRACLLAREHGVKVAISTDAHGTAQLDNLRFGVNQARRGWLTADDVVNTRDLAGLRRLLG
ncbi:MAG: DNA polymerase/3'-5' exonuclease PolX [Pseudomonadota bacterium]